MTKYAPPELVAEVLRVLREGPVESAAGNATALLCEYTGAYRAGAQGTVYIRLALRSLERAGVIERDVRGGRTYWIRLAGKEMQ